MKFSQKVLFLGHDASRTGAPLLLLEIVRWLASNSAIEPEVLLKRGGVILPDFRAVAPTRCLEEESEKLRPTLVRRICQKLGVLRPRSLEPSKWYPLEDYKVVYANTIDTCDLAKQIFVPGRKLLQHIHELEYTTTVFGATEGLKESIDFTDAYVAVSGAVQDFLIRSIRVPEDKVHVIHEFPIAAPLESDRRSDERMKLRQQLGIPDKAFVVGMCGLPQWRKGTDLFVQLARQVTELAPPGQCHFLWLGGNLIDQREALHDVAQVGLADVCHFVPAVANPDAYFHAFDLFALTSREDPFPVAMLEAALSGLAIVCFAGGGGAPELVEDDAGVVVPYLDVPAMARACVELWRDDSRRRQMGQSAKTKVETRYMLDIQGPKILAVINATLARNSAE
jgi:glycosyltransferase involved in cell wall biosynthesis